MTQCTYTQIMQATCQRNASFIDVMMQKNTSDSAALALHELFEQEWRIFTISTHTDPEVRSNLSQLRIEYVLARRKVSLWLGYREFQRAYKEHRKAQGNIIHGTAVPIFDRHGDPVLCKPITIKTLAGSKTR
jgi:hypothetical protein